MISGKGGQGRKMSYRKYETAGERAAREVGEAAFWDQPDALRQLTIPEEDLPPSHRGGPYRVFRSPNVIDLVRIMEERAVKPADIPSA
jgi:hypothetical protein